LGANAVIGVDIDYESFGKTNGMMMVSATGTAVIIDRAWPASLTRIPVTQQRPVCRNKTAVRNQSPW